MSFLIGGGTAAGLLLLDLTLARRYRVTLIGLPWWVLRLCLEGVQGAAAVLAVELAALRFDGFDEVVVCMIAGASAPRLIRGLQYGGGTRDISIDLKGLIDHLSLPLEELIDGTSAQAKSASDHRLTSKLLRRGVTPDHLARELRATMASRRALSSKLADAEYISETAESTDSMAERLRLMVAHAREIQALGTVKRLAR